MAKSIAVCRIAHLQIRNICRIQNIVPKSATIPCAHVYLCATSQLDYINGSYNCIAKSNMQML